MPAYTTPNKKPAEDATYTVGELEHKLRVAFSVGGRKNGMDMAKETADEWEDIDVTILKYLKEKRDEMSADLWEEFEPTVKENIEFYAELETCLASRVQRAQERLRYDEVYFETHMVVEDGTDLDSISEDNNPIHVSDLDHMDDLSDYDLDLPTPLMCAHSDRKSTSIYPFIPVNDVLICTCGDKLRTPDSPLCFHELAALLELNEEQLHPDGPDTWVQLASPKAYN